MLANGLKEDLFIEKQSSKELALLYDAFASLIKTKKFENNDFKDKEDALAIIDLAEASIMFIEEKPEPN